MSHVVTSAGRAAVVCDDPSVDPVTFEVTRCGRRSTGRRGLAAGLDRLSLFDLPRNWSVAPYPDDFDHGVPRRNLIDGSMIEPIATLAGVVGDLHTCPSCYRRGGTA